MSSECTRIHANVVRLRWISWFSLLSWRIVGDAGRSAIAIIRGPLVAADAENRADSVSSSIIGEEDVVVGEKNSRGRKRFYINPIVGENAVRHVDRR